MTFSLQPHEVDMIETALIALGGKYNDKAKNADTMEAKLYRAKADQVFGLVCKLPSTATEECCAEIAANTVELSKIAWGNWFG